MRRRWIGTGGIVGVCLGLGISGVLVMQEGCKKPLCNGVLCVHGYCDEATGSCVCFPGYYGTNCQVECVHGTGSDDGCTCDAGYMGASCDTPINTTIAGVYRLIDYCPGDTVAVEYAEFRPSQSNPQDVHIVSFGGWLCNHRPITIRMRLQPNLTGLILPDTQRVCNDWLEVLYAEGDVMGKEVRIRYVYTDYSGVVPKTETCTTYYTRIDP